MSDTSILSHTTNKNHYLEQTFYRYSQLLAGRRRPAPGFKATKLVGMASNKRLTSSAQMALVAGISEGLSLLTLALAFFVNVGSPTTVLATMMVFIVLSLIFALLATVLGVVGLVKYARHQWIFVAVIVLSILLNPVVWLGALALLN